VKVRAVAFPIALGATVASAVDIMTCGAGGGVSGPIPGSTIVAIDVTIHDNTATALQAQSVRAVNVSVTNNAGLGIRASRAQMTDSTITGNADIGIAVERARLRNSTATGNDGSGAGVDLSTSRRPRLHASTCGKSQVAGQPPGTTWGVCTND
jgi:parallel beta helix pectate lyase-like protein